MVVLVSVIYKHETKLGGGIVPGVLCWIQYKGSILSCIPSLHSDGGKYCGYDILRSADRITKGSNAAGNRHLGLLVQK